MVVTGEITRVAVPVDVWPLVTYVLVDVVVLVVLGSYVDVDVPRVEVPKNTSQ